MIYRMPIEPKNFGLRKKMKKTESELKNAWEKKYLIVDMCFLFTSVTLAGISELSSHLFSSKVGQEN